MFENLENTDQESSVVGLATVKKLLQETGEKIWVEASKKSWEQNLYLQSTKINNKWVELVEKHQAHLYLNKAFSRH